MTGEDPGVTDELPSSWHSDSYIRRWAQDRGLGRYPTARVPLCIVSPKIPDIAEIDFETPGFPVRRVRSS
jgi:hypothetical protein